MVFGFTGFGEGIDYARYKWVIYVLVFIIAVMIVLSLAGVTMERIGLTGKAPAPEEKLFWKRFDPLVPLRVTYKETGPNLRFDRYTILIDMFWINTRVNTTSTKYRHILHRGSGEGADFLQIQPDIRTASAQAPPITGTADESEILARMPQGLPVRMNPGIMADPVKNDMIIFVDTENDGTSYRESVRIPDIPLSQPFQMAIVVMPNMLEVYINCGLEVTKMLEGRPRDIESAWYGLIGPSPLNAMVQNLRIFTGPLSPMQLKGYCAKTPDFTEAKGCDQQQIAAQAQGQIKAAA